MRILPAALLLAATLGPAARAAPRKAAPRLVEIRIQPSPVLLRGADASRTVLVTGRLADGRLIDLSDRARYSLSDARVARVSAGVVTPLHDGRTTLIASYGKGRAAVPVRVQGASRRRLVSFGNQVLPVLTRAGCNSGACHGKAAGQNGFRLSLLGYDPDLDYRSIVRDAGGRRVCRPEPARSLLLAKPAGDIPHAGGVRFRHGSPEYRLLSRWLAEGARPGDPAAEPRVTGLRLEPRERLLSHPGDRQRLVATATYSDGEERDVTREAQFLSNDTGVAEARPDGTVIVGSAAGDAAIMARFMGQVAVARVTVPMAGTGHPLPPFPCWNLVDGPIYARLKRQNITPSELCTDGEFIRRASLDATGTLPAPEEVRAFLRDTAPDKRDRLVDDLLSRPAYAEFWAQRWADLLRNQTSLPWLKAGPWMFHYWIRDCLATNMPYDRFVRALLTAQGTPSRNPAVVWSQQLAQSSITNDTAQVFLGMRLNCAQCHHHPFERWSQDDYYGFAAFFGRLGNKEGAVYVNTGGEVRHPGTGQVMRPRALDGPVVEVGEFDDPRQKLADWLTAPENPFFARALVNRLWKHYMGRGLVEPVDDLRVTNPPSNPELMDALARDFAAHGFDVRRLTRNILTSRTYQLSAAPRGNNAGDRQCYSHCYDRRLSAEALLDAINQACGTADRFSGVPGGTRAIQLPDATIVSDFLDVFGRPKRETACECERSSSGALAQVLALMNSPEVDAKVRDPHGRAAELAASKRPDAQVVDELYLAAFARLPTEAERKTALAYLASGASGPKGDRRGAVEDLLWTLLNCDEFLFNH